jgi:hypothetical protein
MTNEAQIRGKMMKRSRQLNDLVRTLDAVIHDAQLLQRQLREEINEWEQDVELSLQRQEATNKG